MRLFRRLAPRVTQERTFDRLTLAGLVLYSATAGISIALSQAGYALGLLAWIVPILNGRRRFRRTGLDAFFLAYLAAELLSFAFSQNHLQNLVFMRRLLLIPMFYVVADRVRSPRDLAFVLVPLIGVADLMALGGVVQYWATGGGLEHRVRLLQHVLTTSGLIMLIGFLCLGLCVTVRSLGERAALAASFLLLSLCQLFTYSRSAWLGTLAGLGVFLASLRPRALLLLPAGALLLYAAVPGPIRDRMISAFDPTHSSNIGRVNMWRTGLEILSDHPWTGVGDISIAGLYARYSPPGARDQEVVGHLHNNLIMLAVTLGIPGALVAAALFLRILELLIRNARGLGRGGGSPRGVTVGALAAYVGFLTMGFFEWNFGDAEVTMLLWCLLGLSEAAVRMSRA